MKRLKLNDLPKLNEDVFLGGLPVGHTTLLYAESEAGKSFFSYQQAVLYDSLVVSTEPILVDFWNEIFKDRFGSKFKKPKIHEIFAIDELKYIGRKMKFDISEGGKLNVISTSCPYSKDFENKELIIFDSLAGLIRGHFSLTRQSLGARSDIIFIVLRALQAIARKENCAIIVTTHAGKDPANQYDTLHPWGGASVSFNSKFMFGLKKMKMKVKGHPNLVKLKIMRTRWPDHVNSDWTTFYRKNDWGFIEGDFDKEILK